MDATSLATSSSTLASSSASGDFLSEYRAISGKLRRRFLRRPNISEAGDLFTKLARRLRIEERPEYAALCHLAVARCEQSVGNGAAEADALIAASRDFLTAEKKVQDLGCPSFQEHLMAAVHSYHHAIRLLEESQQPGRAAGLCLELGESLRSLDRPSEALALFQRAADLRANTIPEYMSAREKVAECYLDISDWHNALEAATEVASMAEAYGGRPPRSVYADILARCEVLRVLLLLLIEPTSQNMSPGLSYVLEKYLWECDGNSGAYANSPDSSSSKANVAFLSEEVFLLLQSVVMAAQVKDVSALRQLEDYLAPLLETRPRTLLRKLVKNMQDKTPDTS